MTVLKTILYFSIFKYPLNKIELLEFSQISSEEVLNKQLSILLEKGIVFKFDDFYTNHNTPSIIERRLKGNKKAREIMPKAIKSSKRIAKFPYVENVSISGSLSKNYYDEEGDFDFFIITKPNRLWVCRTLLILYKKIFLLNSKKYFCVNYFISSDHLTISERNRFTATEIVTLLPIYGKEVFNKFIDSNNWTEDLFPNKSITDFEKIEILKKPFSSRLLESIFNTKIGDYLDETFRKLTLKKWKISFDHLDDEDFKIAMKSTKNVSKHHPQNFQKKVTESLEISYNEITKRFNLDS